MCIYTHQGFHWHSLLIITALRYEPIGKVDFVRLNSSIRDEYEMCLPWFGKQSKPNYVLSDDSNQICWTHNGKIWSTQFQTNWGGWIYLGVVHRSHICVASYLKKTLDNFFIHTQKPYSVTSVYCSFATAMIVDWRIGVVINRQSKSDCWFNFGVKQRPNDYVSLQTKNQSAPLRRRPIR